MSTLQIFMSILLGVAAIAILGVPSFIISSYRKRDSLTNYLYNVAIAIDELGGTLLYAQKDRTVSYMTGKYALEGRWAAIAFASFIDLLFGKNHCVNEYYEEEGLPLIDEKWS